MKGSTLGGGAVLGLLLLAAIIIFAAMTGGYKGREEPVPCTSADWKAYAPQCNRWTPEPVIMPQKTGKS